MDGTTAQVWTEKGSENDVGMWMKDVCALILSADVGRTVVTSPCIPIREY